MSDIREHIRECFENKTNIIIEKDHLAGITFEDICMIIHIVTFCDIRVSMSDKAKVYVNYGEFPDVDVTEINAIKTEEVVVLMFIIRYRDRYTSSTLTLDEERKKYKMSENFILAAKNCGVYDHRIAKHIIVSFDMKYEQFREEADDYLNHYFGYNAKKSTS